MSATTMLMIMMVAVVFIAWYANSSKRNKILCTFRRVNKTKIVRFVKMSDRYVIFDKKKYDIIPSRITFQWYTAGLVHMLFPQWVATLDFTDGKRLPLDSNAMNYDWDNPEVRNSLNIAELIKSYFSTANPQKEKKPDFISKYLPWIAVIGVVAVGFWMYTNMQSLGNHLAAMQNTLNALTK